MTQLATMRAAEIESMLIEMLAGATNSSPKVWTRAVGTVEVLPIVLNPKSNWRVIARGTSDEKAAVEKAAELVREHHPYVTPEEAGERESPRRA